VPIELGADELADRRSPSAWRWFINVVIATREPSPTAPSRNASGIRASVMSTLLN